MNINNPILWIKFGQIQSVTIEYKHNVIINLRIRVMWGLIILMNGFASAESFAEMIFNLISPTSSANLITQSLRKIISEFDNTCT